MEKYELKNIPETGVKFELENRRPIVLDESLTDADAEFLLNDGKNTNAAHYIKLKEIPIVILEPIAPIVEKTSPVAEQKVVVVGKIKEV